MTRIRSEEHFMVLERRFERLFKLCCENCDDFYCRDAWNLSMRLLQFADTIKDEFVRNVVKDWVVSMREEILTHASDKLLFELELP